MVTLQTTPKLPLSGRVNRLMQGILNTTQRVRSSIFLPFTFGNENYEPGQCAFNVLHRIRESGGYMVCGWIIWESPIIVEGEFHAVWRDETGFLLDLTPRSDKEETVLFLPDPQRTFAPGDARGTLVRWESMKIIGGHWMPGERATLGFCDATRKHLQRLDFNPDYPFGNNADTVS